jgi:hypothetical protein
MTELTAAQRKRAFFVEVRRGLAILLKASVEYFGVEYMELLPTAAFTAPAPVYSAPTSTPAPEYGGGAD